MRNPIIQGVRGARGVSRPAMLFSLEGSFVRPASRAERYESLFIARTSVRATYLENCIAAVGVLYLSGQDIKGTWWMPWRQKPMKDVDGCDKPR